MLMFEVKLIAKVREGRFDLSAAALGQLKATFNNLLRSRSEMPMMKPDG
jgi:hypothetical protein